VFVSKRKTVNISGISTANDDRSEFSTVGADLDIYFYSSVIY